MPEYVVKIQWRGLKELRKILDPATAKAAMDEGLTDGALDVQARAKRYAPRKTGLLQSSIRVWGRQTGPTRRIVAGGGRVRYAVPIHEGSGLYGSRGSKYPIRPKNKKFLFFPSQSVTSERFGAKAKLQFRKSGKLSNRSMKRYGNAAYVVARVVMHPGVKAVPFMKRAIQEAPLAELLGKALYRAWSRQQR